MISSNSFNRQSFSRNTSLTNSTDEGPYEPSSTIEASKRKREALQRYEDRLERQRLRELLADEW